MVRVGTPPEGRRSSTNPLWSLPAVLAAVCAGAAVALAPAEARAPVAGSCLVAVVAVAVLTGELIRRGRTIARLQERQAEQEALLRRRLADQQAEMVRLAKDVLPTAVTRLQQGISVDDVLEAIVCDAPVEPDFAAAHRVLLRAVLDTVEAEEALRDSAQRAFVNIARRVQAIVHQQAYDLREMEDKHGADHIVFNDLLHIDHGNALIGRLADSIAVLSGARPGRQWRRTVPLFNVLRGAMSRILDYRRVDLHSVAEIAIVGPGVEPVIHAVAELLDNATRYSPPQTRVHLTASEVQSGVAIEIEDAGVGLTDEAARRAERVLSGVDGGLDLDDLGESPRLGLAVVARLARAHDFKVTLRRSAYGGVRAVLIVGSDITAPTPAPGGRIAEAAVLPPPKPKLRPQINLPGRPAAEPAASPGTGGGTGGLPQRRRRPGAGLRSRYAAGAARPRPTAPDPGAYSPMTVGDGPRVPHDDQPVQPGMWLTGFYRGLNGETPSAGREGPDTDDSSGKDE